MTVFTIGCDPEVFVRDRETKKLISCHGLIPGDKKNPHAVRDGAIQVDGLAAEFNTNPVRMGYHAEFSDRVLTVLKQLKNNLAQKNAEIVIEPSVQFAKEYYDSLPEEAKELGCDPDFNAYTGKANPRPDGDSGLRTASGHLHVGWGSDIPADHPDHIAICEGFVRTLDLYCGLYSVIIDPSPVRRTMYGMAGAYRPKPYGVEYRVPSNVWLRSRQSRCAMSVLINYAVSDMTGGNGNLNRIRDEGYDVQSIINTSDVKAARKVLFDKLGMEYYVNNISY